MKRSNWVRLIAVILIISMLAAPVSAATNRGNDGVRTNGVVGIIVDFIRDIIRDIFDDWFDEPGEEEPTPTTPVNPTTPTPTQPGETEPEETDPTEPGETKPTQPGETQPGETEPTEPGETEPEEDEDKPETTMQLIEGYENTENGHLLRGHTYTLSQVIAQQNSKPATTTTANRFGTKLGNGLATGKTNGVKTNATETEVTKELVEITSAESFDSAKSYIFVSERSTTGGMLTTEAYTATISWSGLRINGLKTNGTVSTETTELWNIVAGAEGKYAIKHGDQYLTLDYSNTSTASLTDTATELVLERSGNYWYIRNSDGDYLSNVGGFVNGYYGASGFNEKGGSGWQIFEVVTSETEPEPEPDEPEKPEPLTDLIYFPVTMFNYNNGTTLLNDDRILRDLTHQAELEAGLKETWEGLYFSGGSPSPTTYTYTTGTTAHSDLTWQQVKAGTYYADEACTNVVTVNAEGETGTGYTQTNVTVGDIWNSRGNEVYISSVGVNTFETNYYYYYLNKYYPVYIRNDGDTYYVQFRMTDYHDYLYGVGTNWGAMFGITDTVSLYTNNVSITGYTLTAGGNTLATLDGTDLTVKVGVILYTPAGENSITKSYSAWNWWSYKPANNNSDNDQNKFYTGLVQDELVEGEIKFNVVEPGIFTFDSSDPTVTNDGIKDIYQNVGLPFVKNDQGFYTFDSDAHGTYFKDTTGDGKSDPSYGTSATDYFEMFFDYENTQGWAEEGGNLGYGDGSSNLWAPYNTNTNDTADKIDYHFGMRADIPFSMTPNGRVKSTDDNSDPIKFTFKGDDDVWIFIDGHLVIDLGGIHNRIGATIDFADNTITYFRPESNNKTLPIGSFNNPEKYPLNEDGTVTVKLYNEGSTEGALGKTRVDFAANEEHTMSIFYLERGKGTSNCQIEFNLPMRDTLLITKDATMSWSEKQDAGDGDKDGTASLTAKEQAAVDKLNFGFTLFKKNHDETAFTEVKNTNFFVQDKDGNVIATSSTDGNGKFYLKNGQTAKFMTDFPKDGVTYYVVEDAVPAGFLTPDYKYAGVATDGFEYIGSCMNPDGSNFEMTEAIKVSNASQIPEHELPMNAKENKSYEITAYGSIEAIDSLEFICVNYLNADLPNPTAIANEDIIVIDYGLPVQIDPLHNDLFRGEDIEIVAWGDEALTLSEKLDEHGFAIDAETTWTDNKVLAAAYVSNGTTYSSTPVDMADCLYTFKKNADGTYEIFSTTADGTKVYLNQYTTDHDKVPNDSIPGKISVSESTYENMFRLLANAVEGGSGKNRTLHFHSDADMPYWNRCGDDTSKKCSEYLYRPASDNDQSSTEIPGYVMVTSLDEIKDGGQYLIVHDSDVDSNLYVLHPSTSNSQWDHVAKVGTTTSPAIGTSFSFDSGNVTFKDKTYAEYEHKNEKNETYYTYDRDTFEYELTEQLTEVEEINYIIKVTSTVKETVGNEEITKTACRYALGKIYIVPATIMYYEENFSDMITFEGAGWDEDFTVSNQNNVSPFQEPGVVGTVGDSTYGSDVAYLSDNGDSNGTYRFGDTTNKAIRFTYTFTGTGTSIFARTSALTGYMQVKIFAIGEDGQETLQSTTYRDTYWKDENKTDLDASGTLYNIPVFTEEFQHYGTYKVVCTVAKAGTTTAGNDKGSGNEFYLDGIRVMQPLNEDSDQDLVERAQDAYATDGESNLDVVTLRQKLITDYETPDDQTEKEWPFAVLTDINGEVVYASDYISIGPKEEVYLSKDPNASNGQKVSFSLKYWEPEGLKLYMGMKAPFGNAKVHVGHDTYELKNAPDCYYDVTDNYESLLKKTEQATDDGGNLLFLDDNDNFIVKIVSNDGTVAYYYDDYKTVFNDIEELRPLMMEYYVVTYTFEAAESIVSLTNIKVVGQYEFSIVEDTNINVEGPEGGSDVEPNEP